MIPKSAVRAYLKRPRESYNWLKRLKTKEVEHLLRGAVDPKLYEGLRLHQKVCLLIGVACPQFFFMLDMGTGKTLVSIRLIQHWYSTGKLKKVLVLAPTNEVVDTWEEQLQRWAPGFPYVCLRASSSVRKWELFEKQKRGVIVVSYPGLTAMVSDKVPVKQSDKRKLKPQKSEVKLIASSVQGLILDESTKVANTKSLSHRICRAIGKRVEFRYALAGRPFGRDPTALWGQFFLIDRGEALGQSLGLFREAFFTKSVNPWGGEHSFDYTFNKKKEVQLSRLMAHRSIRYSADECIDLPKLVSVVEEVRLPEDTEVYYGKVVQRVIRAKGDFREMKNAFLRLRQISSGFVGFKDDETGERAEVAFDTNPKLDLLVEFLEQMPLDSKAVVFHEFTWSGRRIVQALKDAKIGAAWIWSGTKDSKAEKKRFLKEDDCRVMLLNHKKGAYGVDGLQEVANYTFFYESPVSPIDREQAERRVRRQGQTKRVFQYDLIVRNTMDQRILDFHREGTDLFRALVSDPISVTSKGLKFSG